MLRLPLEKDTVRHIYARCKSARSRRDFVKREIEIIFANLRAGVIARSDALWSLDMLSELV